MSPYDNTGRIHKQVFLISNLTLFGLCLMSTCARFFIRIRIQKTFSIDDGILLFGIGCLIAAMVLLLNFVDKMYLVGATESGTPGIELPPDFLNQAFDFQKYVAVALILTWSSIMSVKFSYLFLFKRLIDRMPRMITYWWFVFAFNAVESAYGAAVYIVICPDFYNLKSIQCAFGEGVQKSIAYSVSQMVLDIAGDLMILYIPCQIIWSTTIRWTQKIALSACLCLTIITVIVTITRIAGLHTGRAVKSIDSVWETYWQYIAANLALTMTATTAFRTFFISRAKDGRPRSPASKNTWYEKSKRRLLSAFTLRSWRSQPRENSSANASTDIGALELSNRIPRGTMTGIQTFIRSQGKPKTSGSGVMHSMVEEEYDDSWPLSTHDENSREIQVQHDVILVSEQA